MSLFKAAPVEQDEQQAARPVASRKNLLEMSIVDSSKNLFEIEAMF